MAKGHSQPSSWLLLLAVFVTVRAADMADGKELELHEFLMVLGVVYIYHIGGEASCYPLVCALLWAIMGPSRLMGPTFHETGSCPGLATHPRLTAISPLFQWHPRDCTFVYSQQTVFIGTAGSGQHCW